MEKKLKNINDFELLLEGLLGSELFLIESPLKNKFKEAFLYHLNNLESMTPYFQSHYLMCLKKIYNYDIEKHLTKGVLKNLLKELKYIENQEELNLKKRENENDGTERSPSFDLSLYEGWVINWIEKTGDEDCYKLFLQTVKDRSSFKNIVNFYYNNPSWINYAEDLTEKEIIDFFTKDYTPNLKHQSKEFESFITKNIKKEYLKNLDPNVIRIILNHYPETISSNERLEMIESKLLDFKNNKLEFSNFTKFLSMYGRTSWEREWEEFSLKNKGLLKECLNKTNKTSLSKVIACTNSESIVDSLRNLGLDFDYVVGDKTITNREGLKSKIMTSLNIKATDREEEIINKINKINNVATEINLYNLMQEDFKMYLFMELKGLLTPRYDGKFSFFQKNENKKIFADYFMTSDEDFNIPEDSYELFYLKYKN